MMAQQRLARGARRGFVLVGMVLCTFTFTACPENPEGRTANNVQMGPSTPVTVTISPATTQLGIGGTATLSAQVTGGTAADRANVAWSSSSPGVATVSGSGISATVSGVAPGSASIRASAGGTTGSASVTVTGGSTTSPGAGVRPGE